jgi:hypothetical protein
MPVGVVITLLRAFKTGSASVVVLTGFGGGTSAETSFLLTVSNEETHVSATGSTGLVEFKRLVESEVISGSFNALVGGTGKFGGVGWGSVTGSTVTDQVGGISSLRTAHVLDDDVTVHLGVDTASMLIGPFKRKQRTFVESHFWSPAVSSLGIVLSVHETIVVLSVGIGFTISVVAASQVVHVHVTVAS